MFIIPKTQGQNGKNALHTTLIILGIFRADVAKKCIYFSMEKHQFNKILNLGN